MIESHKLLSIGEATTSELDLIAYIGNCIASYIKVKETDRGELIVALFNMCRVVFTHQTHGDFNFQCNEIDDFCYYLKDHAKRVSEKNKLDL
jgi:hypothetical protein